MTSMPADFERDVELARERVIDILSRHIIPSESASVADAWKVTLVRRGMGHGGALIFAAGPEEGQPAVAAKLYDIPIQARREFRSARAAWARGVPVAGPLAVFRRTGLIVSRWVPGPTLEAELATGRGLEVARQAGRWLRRFHGRSRIRLAFHRPSRDRIWLSQLAAETRPRLAATDLAAFDETVAEVMATAQRQPVALHRHVHLHGDVSPSNLICSPGGVVGVDLVAGEQGSPWREIALMGVHLGIAAMDGPVRSDDPSATRDAFWEGYGLGQGRLRKRVALFEGFELLRRWRAEVSAATPRPRRIRTLRMLLARRGFGPSP